ncbi:glycoside hydrolase family 3 C-terminal domain-containing protein, partial [Micromonospora sp. DH15]|nr:glycoside hydrolase family 3 C-terminal domain-containing protein [Micromonospora sp. DH15]
MQNDPQPTDLGDVRVANRAVVLRHVRVHAPCSRADIAARTGLNKATVSSLVGELIERRLVRETGLTENRIGRPATMLVLDGEPYAALGLQVGADELAAVAVDLGGNRLLTWRRAFAAPAATPAETVRALAALARRATARVAGEGRAVLGLTVGVPGLVDAAGCVPLSPALGWRDVPLADQLRAALRDPDFTVAVDNEANLATAYARGLRGDHPDRLRTAPTLKHFLGYNNETDRATTSSDLPPRVLHEYELPAFRAPLAAGAAVAVMASYNLVNGVPAHLSPLIEGELRPMAADEIMVVGDAGAATNIAGVQGREPDHVHGFAAALRAGIDNFTEDDTNSALTTGRITEALERGLITTAHVDRAVRRILGVRLRLGDLDPAHEDPWAGVAPDVVDCPAHRELAREAARQCVVLLRNDGLLPLTARPGLRVAVLGPLADAVHTDWYSGTLPYAVSTLDALAARVGTVTSHSGADRIALRAGDRYVRCATDADGGPLTLDATAATEATWFDVFDWGGDAVALRAVANGRHVGGDDDAGLVNDRTGPGGWIVRETFRFRSGPDGTVLLHHLATGRYVAVGPDGRLRADAAEPGAGTPFAVELVADGAAEAAALAADADVVVVALGNHPMVNGRETEDRVDLALPAGQEALLRAAYAANPRTVLALTSSYPYAIGWADAHLPAVLWSAHGGQEHGAALAAVLFGDAEPGGRLTQTWYADAA